MSETVNVPFILPLLPRCLWEGCFSNSWTSASSEDTIWSKLATYEQFIHAECVWKLQIYLHSEVSLFSQGCYNEGAALATGQHHPALKTHVKQCILHQYPCSKQLMSKMCETRFTVPSFILPLLPGCFLWGGCCSGCFGNWWISAASNESIQWTPMNTMNNACGLDACENYLHPSVCLFSLVFYEEGAALAAFVNGNSQQALKTLFNEHHHNMMNNLSWLHVRVLLSRVLSLGGCQSCGHTPKSSKACVPRKFLNFEPSESGFWRPPRQFRGPSRCAWYHKQISG